ncbi:NAD(P)/FAD-dependent oxidoreductase [Luteimicrobium album]|uniref:NAD(P)/FAD-dependent oxidoreductase n=1 Tax=Luteimicrobium album TaxID=1054550 RepID=UPI0024E09BA8|nr:FAD-dependent oxidoreductase [Luteimicrobium album]
MTSDREGSLRSVVVVGGGLAGAQTAAALRAQGFDGRVTLLGAEGRAPYDRPPLSKELFERDSPADLVHEVGVDVAALADDLRPAEPAHALEVRPDGVVVATSSGEVEADAVVLAVGSRPVVPAGWEAAAVLHTWDDAARLRARLTPGARLVSVGAGWIGAEVAGVATKAGCEVVVVEALDVPLERQLGADVGKHLAPWYAAAGVELRLGEAVVAIRPDDGGDGASVELASGAVLHGDVVLAAVGARPATDWLRDTLPVDARGSIAGDAVGRVAPRVYAVGDCVTRHGTVYGDVPGGHWSAALHDPESTVRALLSDLGPGAGAESGVPGHAPYVFSQQLGHDLALFGTPSAFDEVVLRGLPGHDDGWAALYLDGDNAQTHDGRPVARLRGVLVVDRHREVGALRRLLRAGLPLVDVEAAADPSRPLKDAVVILP